MAMARRAYLFKGGAFGQRCDEDVRKENNAIFKYNMRSMNHHEQNYYWARHCHLRHRERVAKVEAIVDNIEPLVPTAIASCNYVWNRKLDKLALIEQENALLVKKIQMIYLGKGRIDNQLAPYVKSTHDTSKRRKERIMAETFKNCYLYRRLQAVKPTMSRQEQLDWHRKQKLIQERICRFPLFEDSRMCAPFEKVAWAKAKENPMPIVYMDIEALDKVCGRICIQLMAYVCPMAAENFRSLCAGDRGFSYVCTTISHIRPGMFWRGGGQSGLTSIYGESFPNENSRIKHDKAGILSMTSHGWKTNNTEWQISAKALPPLDGNYVAFGQVIQGMDFLEELARACKPRETGALRVPAKVTACGETTMPGIQKLPEPILYKHKKAKLAKAREARGILELQQKVQDLKAELEDLSRYSSADSIDMDDS